MRRDLQCGNHYCDYGRMEFLPMRSVPSRLLLSLRCPAHVPSWFPAEYGGREWGYIMLCGACPAGQYTDASIVFFCTACSAGGYCLGGAPRQLCPANTFNPSVGRSSECTICSTGYFSATGAVSCASSTFSPNGILTDTSLFCNASVSLSTSVSLDRVITFVNNTVGDSPPLLFLPASSFYNPLPKDIVVASTSACSSFITTPGATKCIASSNYILPTGNFSFLGEAASLGMTAAPYCGS